MTPPPHREHAGEGALLHPEVAAGAHGAQGLRLLQQVGKLVSLPSILTKTGHRVFKIEVKDDAKTRTTFNECFTTLFICVCLFI